MTTGTDEERAEAAQADPVEVVDGETDAADPQVTETPAATPPDGGRGDRFARPRAALGALRERVLRGDRPYALAFLGSLVVAVLIVSGPWQTWAEERDLVEFRRTTLELLDEENQRLDRRVEDLNDPETIEFEAREEQGMYRPGEVPYVVIPPAVDQPQLRPEVDPDAQRESGFIERIREAIAEILD